VLEVRPARDADLDLVLNLLSGASRRLAARGVQFWWDPFPPDEVVPSVAAGETFLALLDGDVVGTLSVAWSDHHIWGTRPGDAGYIHRLAVLPAAAGQALGSQILTWAAQHVADHGPTVLRLDTMAPDPGDHPEHGPRAALHRWYRSQGFVSVGEVDAPIIGDGGVELTYRTVLYERALGVTDD
jgi:protein-tyrosine phosphatase